MAKMDKRFVSDEMIPLIEKRKELRKEISEQTEILRQLYNKNYNAWEKKIRQENKKRRIARFTKI